MKAINKGMMAILRAFPNLVKRPDPDVVVISFWINKPKRTRIPISATEPAMVAVVTVVMVDVVTVEIIYPPLSFTTSLDGYARSSTQYNIKRPMNCITDHNLICFVSCLHVGDDPSNAGTTPMQTTLINQNRPADAGRWQRSRRDLNPRSLP